MAKLFDSIRSRRPRRNKFDLSHEKKMSLNMGDLVPIYIQDIVPGDSFRVKTEIMLRMAPMLAPIMHRVNVFTHYFFVPNRLVWNEWEDFITGGREGTSTPVSPFMQTHDMTAPGVNRMGIGSLSDYLGLPILDSQPATSINVSAIPFRAWQLIYDEYYRDQNLSPSLDISKASGVVNGAELLKITEMRKRAWEKDYFTSALPWAQRGGSVDLPFGEGQVTYKPASEVFSQSGDPELDNTLLGTSLDSAGNLLHAKQGLTNEGNPSRIENIDEISVTGGNINDLRRSIRLQEWLEKNARGGARYIEQILSHFGVKSSDARLQRPEYLGGGKTPVVISEVLSTFQEPSGTGNPQGNMAGHGFSMGTSNGFRRSFEEHGYILGVMSIIPRTAYQQGVPRHFSRDDKFDYFWPEFANIGEQEVLNKELFYNVGANPNPPTGTFGYQSRYSEYKYGCSTVHGQMRESQAFWHMGRIFDSQPVLNESFVEADPTTRIFAVEEASEHLYAQLYNRVDALRPMPYYGTPVL